MSSTETINFEHNSSILILVLWYHILITKGMNKEYCLLCLTFFQFFKLSSIQINYFEKTLPATIRIPNQRSVKKCTCNPIPWRPNQEKIRLPAGVSRRLGWKFRRLELMGETTLILQYSNDTFFLLKIKQWHLLNPSLMYSTLNFLLALTFERLQWRPAVSQFIKQSHGKKWKYQQTSNVLLSEKFSSHQMHRE